jgi:hypothetical protein
MLSRGAYAHGTKTGGSTSRSGRNSDPPVFVVPRSWENGNQANFILICPLHALHDLESLGLNEPKTQTMPRLGSRINAEAFSLKAIVSFPVLWECPEPLRNGARC